MEGKNYFPVFSLILCVAVRFILADIIVVINFNSIFCQISVLDLIYNIIKPYFICNCNKDSTE
jgi:hypothetical protein